MGCHSSLPVASETPPSSSISDQKPDGTHAASVVFQRLSIFQDARRSQTHESRLSRERERERESDVSDRECRALSACVRSVSLI